MAKCRNVVVRVLSAEGADHGLGLKGADAAKKADASVECWSTVIADWALLRGSTDTLANPSCAVLRVMGSAFAPKPASGAAPSKKPFIGLTLEGAVWEGKGNGWKVHSSGSSSKRPAPEPDEGAVSGSGTGTSGTSKKSKKLSK
ncbi:hypothetical protein HDU93_006917 [Gonapodya sp. JEL0774]|nr:hypothetical protein HDU93_006917 [Gonapodya sp. JEL0774]